MQSVANYATWSVAILATLCVILRPLKIPEAVWPMAAAVVLLVSGLLPPNVAMRGVLKGLDVYLFLIGMMLLAELARQEGLFDWLAARAAAAAHGSAARLFTLLYGIGILVTVFLSNDATAVVLTPAVTAVVRATKVTRPLPYVFVCAFIANAASFMLPISNPANLVIYSGRMPALPEWLSRFALPCALSIVVTYALLRWSQREALHQQLAMDVPSLPLTVSGKVTAAGIGVTAIVLMTASAYRLELGLPTCIASLSTLAVVGLTQQVSPWRIVRSISWGILPLTAGLFMLVEAIDRTGVIRALSRLLLLHAQRPTAVSAIAAGAGVSIAANLINNLPTGLIAGMAMHQTELPDELMAALLIGVDLGPNLSVTGSLATLLWLAILRRDGIEVTAWHFFKLGCLIMPPAMLAALVAL